MVGTGKTSLAANLVDSGCRRGQRCLYLAFEEAPGQIMRNMRSIGVDLTPWVKRDCSSSMPAGFRSRVWKNISFRCSRPLNFNSRLLW